MKKTAILLFITVPVLPFGWQGDGQYAARDVMIPARDGVKLHTVDKGKLAAVRHLIHRLADNVSNEDSQAYYVRHLFRAPKA
jgi:hypothetical protein